MQRQAESFYGLCIKCTYFDKRFLVGVRRGNVKIERFDENVHLSLEESYFRISHSGFSPQKKGCLFQTALLKFFNHAHQADNKQVAYFDLLD